MSKELDGFYKILAGLNDKQHEQPLFGLTDPLGGLNNLRSLADLNGKVPLLPVSPPPATTPADILSRMPIARPHFGRPVFPVSPGSTPPTPPPAPAKPDMDWIRSFSRLMSRKRVLVKDGRVLPSIDDLAVMEGRRVNAAFVYSDLHGFTKLVAAHPENKSFVFLHTFVEIANRLTKHYGGQVVDCAGDRVLSVFHRSPLDISDDPVHDAITFGLYLQTAFDRAIGPVFAAELGQQLSLGIGIDYGPAVVGCVGVRSNKKIVFFGDAANNAAKLQELAGPNETILSYGVSLRKPQYLETSPGWILTWGRAADGSPILRTNCVFKETCKSPLIKERQKNGWSPTHGGEGPSGAGAVAPGKRVRAGRRGERRRDSGAGNIRAVPRPVGQSLAPRDESGVSWRYVPLAVSESSCLHRELLLQQPQPAHQLGAIFRPPAYL